MMEHTQNQLEAALLSERHSDGAPRTLRIGVTIPPTETNLIGRIHDLAQLAEGLGFADLWVQDHTVFPIALPDALVTASVALAATTTIGVAFGVVQLGMRHPVSFAHSIATLAAEGGDRILLGVGIGGDHQIEWDALGIPVRERVPRFDESLPLLSDLIEGRACAHAGVHYSFDVPALKPAPSTHVPLWMGARCASVVRRLAYIDGWLGLYRRPDDFAQDVHLLTETAEGLGRPVPEAGMSMLVGVVGTEEQARLTAATALLEAYGTPVERGAKVVTAGADNVRAQVDRYVQAGASRIVLSTMEDPETAWPVLAAALL
jgi:alkanesulfonate monooxygenase SsuD/methylene tetrahydromethanopterin reductase-like flavin-dependent oxidoreductase (luciferase family)